MIAAGRMLVLLPMIPVLICDQKRLVKGILAGATQGTSLVASTQLIERLERTME
jgi:hypothetical protein